MAKIVVVTGGVVSSLGKGLAAASIGALLEGRCEPPERGVEHRAHVRERIPLRGVLQREEHHVVAQHVGVQGVVPARLIGEVLLPAAEGGGDARRVAPRIFQALAAASMEAESGGKPAALERQLRRDLDAIPGAQVDYASIVEEGTLEGGFGSALLEAANAAGLDTRHIVRLGLPDDTALIPGMSVEVNIIAREKPDVLLIFGDDQGEVLLAGADARPDQPRTMFALRSVLERVRDCPSRNKLVIFDLFWPLADPRDVEFERIQQFGARALHKIQILAVIHHTTSIGIFVINLHRPVELH